MSLTLFYYEFALLVVVALGWLTGRWLVQRYRGRSGLDGRSPEEPEPGSERLTDAIGFVGGAYGILLGLLLVFAVGHFVDTRQVSREEAITAAALFNAVNPYPAESRDPLRHDLVCYMRSAATDDWTAAQQGDLTGSENTNAYAMSVQRQIEALPQEEAVEASNHYFVTEEILDLAKSRQLRLLYALPEIPPVIWLVVYVSAYAFVALMVFHLGRRRWLTTLALPATTLVLAAIIGALIQLDAPFNGIGATLRPVALEAAATRLHDANPEPAAVWDPCERLEAEEWG
ncbi:MAG: hypothetical protein QG597_2409 [Actinomycetota bacterium]|nr:hypothetical protein [Actinomycetota bacterium]